MWAVLLGVLLVLVAAMSSHAATLVTLSGHQLSDLETPAQPRPATTGRASLRAPLTVLLALADPVFIRLRI